jgi:hypothetical protein
VLDRDPEGTKHQEPSQHRNDNHIRQTMQVHADRRGELLAARELFQIELKHPGPAVQQREPPER